MALRILIVEDNNDTRFMLSKLLVLEGYEVIECICGLEALKELDKSQQIDLVLTDAAMPIVTGLEVAKRTQELHIPTIIYTAYTEALLIVRAKEFGAIVLTKPGDFDNISKTIKEMLSIIH